MDVIKTSREVAVKRTDKDLKAYAQDYLQAKKNMATYSAKADEIEASKQKIMKVFNATNEDWKSWQWQLNHRINDVETLGKIINLNVEERKDLEHIASKFRWGFSPYLASLMDPNDENCPVRKQMIPTIEEMSMTGVPDFSGEEYNKPAPNLVRWYPDRVIIYITNICAGFCRHCLRRRHIGEVDKAIPFDEFKPALKYIRENPEIRDVLLTGGDPLTYPDNKIDSLLTELDNIDSVEIKRIGSRMPVVVPQRITPELCEMLGKHHPLYINIQVNHPKEITPELAKAVDMLTKAGISVGNQTVLLKGINDDKHIIKCLNHELLRIRVRPYYIYHCQGTIGIEHFRTPVEKGIEILENLRGFTSGLAVPEYIITPSGLGKTPLSPQYQVSAGEDHLILRNWEGKTYKYHNPKCTCEPDNR